jgi:hypothetical protein
MLLACYPCLPVFRQTYTTQGKLIGLSYSCMRLQNPLAITKAGNRKCEFLLLELERTATLAGLHSRQYQFPKAVSSWTVLQSHADPSCRNYTACGKTFCCANSTTL